MIPETPLTDLGMCVNPRAVNPKFKSVDLQIVLYEIPSHAANHDITAGNELSIFVRK